MDIMQGRVQGWHRDTRITRIISHKKRLGRKVVVSTLLHSRITRIDRTQCIRTGQRRRGDRAAVTLCTAPRCTCGEYRGWMWRAMKDESGTNSALSVATIGG